MAGRLGSGLRHTGTTWRGQWLLLTPLAYRLFARPGSVHSRAQSLDSAHADARDVSDRGIDSHIENLRRKIDAAEPGCDGSASVCCVGYRFVAPV